MRIPLEIVSATSCAGLREPATQAIQLHNGTVTARNAKDGGLIVTFVVPRW